jgi:hypothetical protein
MIDVKALSFNIILSLKTMLKFAFIYKSCDLNLYCVKIINMAIIIVKVFSRKVNFLTYTS